MLPTVFLFRDDVRKNCIFSTLHAKGEIFHVIERPWLNNARNKSCIPVGRYPAAFLPRSASGRYKNVYLLHNVVNRAGILIHNGNLVIHSKGCIIIGKRRGMLAGQPAVLNSRTALYEFMELMGKESFTLAVYGLQELSIAA